MNSFNQTKKTKVVAIKNFDEELYRLIKTYASLEGRTITSIFEEALRKWLESRGDYREVYLWVKLEEAYMENLRTFNEHKSRLNKHKEGYVLVCDGNLIGVFPDYEDALRKSSETCKIHGLIIKLPYKSGREEIDLGLPW